MVRTSAAPADVASRSPTARPPSPRLSFGLRSSLTTEHPSVEGRSAPDKRRVSSRLPQAMSGLAARPVRRPGGASSERRIPHAALERPPRPSRPPRRTRPSSRSATRSSARSSSPTGRRLPGYRDVTDGAVGVRPVAARPQRQEPEGVQGGLRGPPRRRPLRRHRTRPAGARHDVDADPPADAQHDERGGPAGRPRPPLHGAGLQRARARVAEPPDGLTRLAPRGRHVGGRGAHAPLPHEGPRRDDPDLPPVLRALHADGPGRQRHGAGPEVQVRAEAERPLGRDARLPARRRRRSATSSSPAATWRTSPPSASRSGCSS